MNVQRILLVIFLCWLGMGVVHAQVTADSCETGAGCSRQDAYDAAVLKVNRDGPALCRTIGLAWWLYTGFKVSVYDTQRYIANPECNSVMSTANATIKSWALPECGTNRLWSEIHKQCRLVCPTGFSENFSVPGTCLDQSACLARNSESGFIGVRDIVRPYSSRCVSGCEFKLVGSSVRASHGTNQIFVGDFEFSGDGCSGSLPNTSDSEAKAVKPQECVAAAAGQSFCVKPNGDQCYTAGSTGKQICWKAAETGEKNEANTRQKRNAGGNELAPTLTLPSGDTLVKSGTSITTNINNRNVQNINTTTTNYSTTNGTSAGATGTTDSGQSADGTGSQPGTTPGGSASGGGDCGPASQPVVTGDPILAMITLQTWATRCAVESKDAVTSTGDVGDCATNFTITGPPKSAEVIKLKGLREQICGVDKNLKDGDPNGTGSAPGEGVGLEGEHDGTAVREGEAIGTDGLDSTGLGFSRGCPNMPSINFMGTSVQFDNTVMCNWLALGGTFVLVLAALASLRILIGAV